MRLLATAKLDGAFNITENDVTSVQDWSYIADKIVTAPAEKWANVYLERFLTKEEAVAAGEDIVAQIMQTFCDLLPLLSNVAGLQPPIKCSIVPPPNGGKQQKTTSPVSYP